VFKAPADLPKGLYIFVITDKNYFDFVINNETRFSLETDVNDPIKKMVVKDSPDNELFFKYLNFNREQYSKIQKIQDKLKNAKDKNDSVEIYTNMISELGKELMSYKLDLVKKNPDAFISFMINAMKEPDVPEPPLLPNGRKDSTFAYRYYKGHYWDDVDFADDRLIRTPVFYNKLKKYYDQIVVPVPDSMMFEVDAMIEKSRPNPEMFKYLVWYATYKFETSEIMGFDEIFVHIVDKYYVTGQATWVDQTTTEKIIKKTNKIRGLLLGKTAPNMIMQDTSLALISMHNIKSKYLLLLFWDPDCSHCEQDMPTIKSAYDVAKEKYGLEIFAICSDTSMVKMKAKIKKNHMSWINVNGPRTLTGDFHESYDIISTPVIYLLNEQKEIIAKQIPPGKILEFLENYVNRKKKD
jgi:thioredoxin-related protein